MGKAKTKALILLTPKSHAEWTFLASKATKKRLKIEHDDVGLFIDRGEVLVLESLNPPTIKNDRLIIEIEEGRVEVINSKWEAWTQPIEDAESVFDIDRILSEYESD